MTAPLRTHYDVLGIARDADAGAVRAAWKLHVQVWHPDRFTGEMRDEAERQAQCINEAYTTLRDSSRRAAYDCRLASEEAGSRHDPPRRAAKVRPSAPRPAATPVGTPMAIAEPLTPLQQVAAACNDALAAMRRHPRITASVAAAWLLVFGAGTIMHVLSGPSLPSGSATSAHAAATESSGAAHVTAAEETDLEDLAERARRESEAAEAELAQLLREDAAAQAAADAADARAAAAADPRAGARLAPPAPGAPATSGRTNRAPGAGRRIVRVMPNTA